MQIVVAVAMATLGQVGLLEQLPGRLVRPLEARQAHTSEVEWTVTYLKGGDAGLVERHITRTVGDTVWEVNSGDEHGYHRIAYGRLLSEMPDHVREKAQTEKVERAGPYHSLLFDSDIWHLEHQRNMLPLTGFAVPKAQAKGYRPLDFTMAGIAPWWDNHEASILRLRETLLVGFESATYTVTSRDRIEVITAEFGAKRIEWHLGKTRGGQPVSASFYQGDRLSSSSHTELTEMDGRWFPTSMSFYLRDDEQPCKVIKVQQASFDQPGHIKEITPNDIGVLFGTQLYGHAGRPHRWDGTRLITGEEYDELIYIYGLRPDPYIAEKLAEAMGMTVEEHLAQMDKTMEQWRAKYLEKHGEAPWLAKKTEEPDPWDLYVTEFIKKHKLDEPRIKRANELLKNAKKLRDYRQHKNRSEIAKARRARDEEKLAHYEQISERIFQKVLVYRLEKLVPREQKKAQETGT